jgi:hypothetical protein
MFAIRSDLHREIAGRDLSGWDKFNSQLILRFLGRKKEAVEVRQSESYLYPRH